MISNKEYDVKLAEVRAKHNAILAHEFIDNIKKLAASPEKLDNFEAYLSHHFDTWFSKYANTPENLIYELQSFSGEF